MIKVYVPFKDRDPKDKFMIFDQTRIHYRQYEDVYKIAAYCLFEGNEAGDINQQAMIEEIIKNPSKLKDLAAGDIKESIRKLDTIGYTVD
jgi:hypothetical protein